MTRLMFTQLLLCLFVTLGISQTPCSNCDFSAPCTMSMFDMPICVDDFESSGVGKPFPFKNHTLSMRVDYIITQSMMNTFDVTAMAFDFNDGLGLRTVTAGNTIVVNYTTTGEKTIFWQKCGGGGDCSGTFTVTVKAPSTAYTSPDETWNISTDATWTPTCTAAYTTAENSMFLADDIGTANAYIRFSGDNTTLTKPIVYITGLDVNDVTLTDPSLPPTNNVIRTGGNGWDALTRGMEEAFVDPIDDVETFSQYTVHAISSTKMFV